MLLHHLHQGTKRRFAPVPFPVGFRLQKSFPSSFAAWGGAFRSARFALVWSGVFLELEVRDTGADLELVAGGW